MRDPSGVTDVFREEWPRLVATLVKDVGDLDIAEESVQDAFVEAATRWEKTGRPDRPGAWLLTTARRKAIDRARRSARLRDRIPELERQASREPDVTSHDLIDDQLALLLGCCHPALSPDAQTALTLRVVAGLSTAQIARAFLVSEATMTRRITRSKTKIREAKIPFRVGDRDTLVRRLGPVCGVIYSIFTEGHTSATAASLVRGDLCDEAIWLAELLAELVPDDPEVAGLLALLLLTDSRRATRLDPDGRPVLLADQNRTKWDQAEIARGLAELARAHAMGRAGPYQFQAAIAALHATAPSVEQTDWLAVVRLYDVMLGQQPSAIAALNRAVAVSHADGPAAGLAAIDAIAEADDLRGDLSTYPYFHSARGEMLLQLDRRAEAAACFRSAIDVCHNDTELTHLRARLAATSP